MKPKFRKSQKKSRLSAALPVFLGILVLIVVGFLVVSNFKISQKRSELQAQKEYLEQQLGILEAKKEQLQAQISESVSQDYLEEEARERFNLKKPGEKVVVVLTPEEKEEGNKERKWWNPFTW